MTPLPTDLTETEKRVLRKIVRPHNFASIQTKLLHSSLRYHAIDLKISFVEIYEVVSSLCEKGLLVPDVNLGSRVYRIV